jgi:hypothetical protein
MQMTTMLFARSATALALASALCMSTAGGALGARETGAVKVTVKYTGAGTVDADHRLWVWLFTTPDIGPAAIPIAEMSTEKNGGTVTFDAVGPSEVWIAVAYDTHGGFGGNAPPPSGSPIAIYGTEAGASKPVTPGEEAMVTMTLSDARKMP